MRKLVAVIPVRKGSQRVKDKNIKPFAGKSLLHYKLDVITKLPVDDVIINTDSEIAIEIAEEYGVNVHKRDAYFASSQATNSEYHEYLAEVTNARDLLIAQVTAPFIKKSLYETAISTFDQSPCNSLMSTKKINEFLWYNREPVNYDINNAPNSQDLPNYFAPTFGLVIANRLAMLKAKNFICPNPYFITLNNEEIIDIDTPLDFEFAEFLFEKLKYKEQLFD